MVSTFVADRTATLPKLPTSLIGRQQEIQAIRLMLADGDARLVTLTGPGGVGKSRLAIAVAESMAGAFADGIYYVSLATVRHPGLVPAEIAQTVGLNDDESVSIADALIRRIGTRDMLVILDNFEHVLPAAKIVSTLLAGCPALKILITSRALLNLYGEHVVPVLPLARVDPGRRLAFEQLKASPSVQLFVERATAAHADFALTAENAAAAAAICARLDGLPLAIELAAARTRMLPPRALLARLEQQLPVLTGGPRDLPERQQTMRDTIAWSVDLLPPAARQLLGELSVFVGSWPLEAVEVVCNPALDSFGVLATLVDHNLVRLHEQSDGTPRYSLLEVIREYAAELLDARDDAEAVAQRHAAYYGALPAQVLPHPPTHLDLPARLDRLDAALPNLRAAFAWLLERDPEQALTLALGLSDFWAIRTYFSEGRHWIEAALAKDALLSPPSQALARAELANIVTWLGDFALAEQSAIDAMARFEALQDRSAYAITSFFLARAVGNSGDLERAVALYERTIALNREALNWFEVCMATGNLGAILRYRGEFASAEQLYAEAFDLSRTYSCGSKSIAWFFGLGMLALRRGDLARAPALMRMALQHSRDLGYTRMIAECLDGLGRIAFAEGQVHRAICSIAAADAIFEDFGGSLEAGHAEFVQIRRDLQASVDPAAYSAAVAEGRGRSLDEAIAYALTIDAPSHHEPPIAADAPAVHLSSREKDVLRLLVDGRTNQEIGAALFISPHTAATHVAHILNKLGLESRTAAAAWAVRHGVG